MLHLVKLAVGCATLDVLARRMAAQRVDGHGVVYTRTMPKQVEAVLDGGSLFRVLDGMLLCRQPIADLRTARREDGSMGTLILLRDEIIPVVPRAMRPFQGWRYLKPEDAPADLGDGGTVRGVEDLPPAMRRALAGLCLI